MKKNLPIILMLSALAGGLVTACADSNSTDNNRRQDEAECTPACNGTIAFICDGDTLVKGEDCAKSDKYCTAGKCVSKDSVTECSGKAKQCSTTGKPQVCSGGKWKNSDPCGATQKCLNGTCVSNSAAECTSGSDRCDPNTGIPQHCSDGKWFDQNECDADTEKCVKGACVDSESPDCEENEGQCTSGGLPQICHDGSWMTQLECGSAEKCVNGECIANGDDEPESNCNAAACRTTESEKYQGNACVEGYRAGEYECGCMGDEDCNTGYTCNTIMMLCTRSEEADECDEIECDSMPENNYYGSSCIDINDREKTCGCIEDEDCHEGYVCNTAGKYCQVYEEPEPKCKETECKAKSGNDYVGNVCIDDDTCGCKSNSNCNTGYECDTTKKVCTKSSTQEETCNASTCKAMKGDSYKGNACISDKCGCSKNTECNSGYECDTKTKVCIEKAPEDDPADGFILTIPESVSGTKDSCDAYKQVNKLKSCVWGGSDAPLKYTLTFSNSSEVVIVPSSYSKSMAYIKKQTDTAKYGLEFTKVPKGYDVDFVWQIGSAETNWTTNLLAVTDSSGKSINFKATAQATDMSKTFTMASTATGFSMLHAGGGSKTLSIKTVSVHKSSGTHTDSCDPNTCKGKTGNDYAGNICIAGYNDALECGCTNDTECNTGYSCNKTMGRCTQNSTDVSCTATACKAMTGDSYYGNACVTSNDGDQTCGCTQNTECKSGYMCRLSEKTCVRYCSTSACKSMTGSAYVGSACVDSYFEDEKECGCTSDTDCKSGYKCNTTMMRCVESASSCTATACKAMTGDDYYGNTCVDYYGEVLCGCNSNSDCKSGYTCNTASMICIEKTTSTCTASACKAMTGTAYAGNVCVDGYNAGEKTCGCNSNSDCKTGYRCNTAMMMCTEDTSSCSATACKAMSDDKYYGNICIDYNGEKTCGCNSNSDCRTGFVCDTDIHLCDVDTSCSASACKAMSDNEYYGDICVDDTCGCNSNADCRTGFVCDTDVNLCDKSSAPTKKNLSLSFPKSTVTCESMKSKNTEIDECEQNGKYLLLTYKNGAIVEVNASAYSEGRASLKTTGTDYIKFSELSAGSSIAFTYQHGAEGDSKRDNNTLKLTDNKSKTQTYRALTSIPSNTDINETFSMSSTATELTMEHDGEYQNAVMIKTVTITAP